MTTAIGSPRRVSILMSIFVAAWVLVTWVALARNQTGEMQDQVIAPGRVGLAEIYDDRMAAYKDDLGLLGINLKLQATIIALALLVALLRKDDDRELPAILEMKLPLSIWYLAVPIFAFYLWFQFGYLFDELISNRLALWSLLRALDDPMDGSALSRTTLLRDTGLLDAYFVAFYPTKHAIHVPDPKWLVQAHLYLFCVLLAGTHAAILSTIWTAVVRKGRNHVAWLLGIVVFAVALFALTCSHVQFLLAGHPNSLQSWVVVVAGGMTLSLQAWLSRNRGHLPPAAPSSAATGPREVPVQ